MAAARRKTTIDKRREIAEYCLSHDKGYKGAAEKYDVSYSQVYSWTKDYLANGLENLKDNRGRRKDNEELSKLVKPRRENLRLKRQLEDEQRAAELLKKTLMADLKAVYAAVDEAAALDALDTFSEHWDKKYPKISQSWRDN